MLLVAVLIYCMCMSLCLSNIQCPCVFLVQTKILDSLGMRRYNFTIVIFCCGLMIYKLALNKPHGKDRGEIV